MKLPIFQVDAFTDKPFAGNPAAVCVLREPRDARWMQNVAQVCPGRKRPSPLLTR